MMCLIQQVDRFPFPISLGPNGAQSLVNNTYLLVGAAIAYLLRDGCAALFWRGK
jgi:hypothetical protein